VEIQPVTPEIANALSLKRIEGAPVVETQPDGPAAKAGIVPGDVLVAVDAQPIADGADLAAKIGSMAPGTVVKIEILRNGNEHAISWGAEALFLSCLNRRPRRDPIRRRQAQSHKDLSDLCGTALRRHLRSCFLSVKSRAQVTASKECWRK
jgi:membrane-associated protease RseP (regulator of RpoE activity)